MLVLKAKHDQGQFHYLVSMVIPGPDRFFFGRCTVRAAFPASPCVDGGVWSGAAGDAGPGFMGKTGNKIVFFAFLLFLGAHRHFAD
ncbi:MAG: hypothetical protein LC657_13090, partial [Desulfobacteraceae bacterium]|nr:hypothetical protein [Desulfobacteraceae bacterium]